MLQHGHPPLSYASKITLSTEIEGTTKPQRDKVRERKKKKNPVFQ